MPSLTHAEAAARAALIHVEAYQIDLDLTRGDQVFGSKSKIIFTCTGPEAATFVDVKPQALRRATLNGARLDPAALADGRLPLTGLAAANELVVEADMAYTNTGQGLHRFVDPADERTYVYAGSFLDEAPGIFACFDQPDLKAPFTVSVAADPTWTVAGNGAETEVSRGRWRLATTMPLATYFVTLIAGPYHCVRAHDEYGDVPLAIYARAALARQLDEQAADIFAVTSACMRRYHELFGVRYPFGKYDQAFVPEFTMGAMENPGCVTYRDEYIFTSAVTDAERESRALVIAHEMAHMWFGDLVTMRWWDDLWLNESFAEYLGYRVTAEATEFRAAWTTFSVGRKAGGYAADQRPSTHPVSSEVADTAQALLNFDGIAYAKGASVLRQLVALLGDDAFFAGLRAHFAAHEYGNATLADLLDSLSVASGRELASWSRVWLQTSGVSALRPEVRVDDDGRYTSVEIVQTAPEALRPHRITVSTYGPDGSRSTRHAPGHDAAGHDAAGHDAAGQHSIGRRDTVTVNLDPSTDGGRTPVPGLRGKLARDLLLVNDEDLTYAKVRLDEASLGRLATTLPATGDSLARALLWGSAWDTTRDAELPAARFVDLCVAALPAEHDVAIFDAVLEYVRDFAVARYLPAAARSTALASLADVCRAMLASADAGSGRQLVAVRGLISCAGPDDIARLREWVTDSPRTLPAGLVADPDLRWRVMTRLAVLGAVTEKAIDDEYARDHTGTGHEHAAHARAARPDARAKRDAWSLIVDDDTASNRVLFAAASGFWHPDQEELVAPYVARFVTDMPAMAARRNAQVSERLGLLAYPGFAVDDHTLAAMIRMRDNRSLAPGLRRSVVDETDELTRSVAARRLSVQHSAAGSTGQHPVEQGSGNDL